MFKSWKSPSVAKSPQKRLISILAVIVFIAALTCGILLDDKGLSKNTEFDTKLLSQTNDAILSNYVVEEFLDFDQSTTRAVIIRSEWNEYLENIDSWSKTTTQLEEDLWVFTFNSASDTFLVTSRMFEDDQYCFEAIFDVTNDETVFIDTETLVDMTGSDSDVENYNYHFKIENTTLEELEKELLKFKKLLKKLQIN